VVRASPVESLQRQEEAIELFHDLGRGGETAKFSNTAVISVVDKRIPASHGFHWRIRI
jgi:hypothetical protein